MASPTSIASPPRVGGWRADALPGPWPVRVWSPEAAAPDASLPWLFALDGAAVMTALLAAGEVPSLRVIAIGGDPTAGDAQVRAARAFDYTPPAGQGLRDPRVNDWQAGGADALRDYLAGPLQNALRDQYVVPTGGRTLYGHSYGGLFALYALCSAGASFDTYVAASPALWWLTAQHADAWFDQQLAARPVSDARVLVTAGADESWHVQASGPDGTPASRTGGTATFPAAQALCARLSQARGVQARFHPIADATHHTMLAASARLAADVATHFHTWPPIGSASAGST